MSITLEQVMSEESIQKDLLSFMEKTGKEIILLSNSFVTKMMLLDKVYKRTSY